MDRPERQAEQAIWERVTQRAEASRGEDLRTLLLACMELTGAYRHLAGQFSGKARERIQQLREGEVTNLACLKGIAILSGQGGELLKIWNPTGKPGTKLLEKCYHRTRRSMIEYMARTADGEYGTVFQKMADREAQHCAWLAELIGSTK